MNRPTQAYYMGLKLSSIYDTKGGSKHTEYASFPQPQKRCACLFFHHLKKKAPFTTRVVLHAKKKRRLRCSISRPYKKTLGHSPPFSSFPVPPCLKLGRDFVFVGGEVFFWVLIYRHPLGYRDTPLRLQ